MHPVLCSLVCVQCVTLVLGAHARVKCAGKSKRIRRAITFPQNISDYTSTFAFRAISSSARFLPSRQLRCHVALRSRVYSALLRGLPRGRGGPQGMKCFRRPMIHHAGTGSSSVSSAASLRRSIRSAWASFANSVSGCWIGFSVPMDLAYVWYHSWNVAKTSSRE